MANTYSQIYIHVVFAVQHRASVIENEWETDLYKYITGIVSNKEQKLMIINGMPDHIHILLSLSPDCNLSDLVRDIKSNSSKWINESAFIKSRFEWQNGFGAFSVSHSHLQRVINYIKNQKTHHVKKSFRQEYVEFLAANSIDYDTKYIFKEV